MRVYRGWLMQPGRQDDLNNLLQQELYQLLLYHYYRTKRIKLDELEYMLDYFGKTLPIPSWYKPLEQENTEMSSVIVQRAEGKAFDDQYLDIAMGERDEYFGYAFVDEGEIKYGEMSLENKTEVKEEISTTPNHPLIITLAKDVATEESKQPFVTLSKEDSTPLCVVFMDGDLQGFGSPESSHSMAWSAHQQYLMPKILEYFTDCGEDLDKTFEKLNRANTKSEILNNCFPGTLANGNVVILFSNGKCLSLFKGDKYKKYEWGATSLSFGYEAKPVAVASEAIKKGLGAHSKTNKASVPEVKKEEKKPATAISAAMDKAEDKKANLDYIIRPPHDKFGSVQSLEEWFQKFAHPEDKLSSAELNEYKGQAHKFKGVRVKPTLSNAAFNLLMQKGFFLMAESQDKPVKKETKSELIVPVIIIPKPELEKAERFNDKLIKIKQDDGSGMIYKPETIVEYMKKKALPSATDQLGYQMGLDEFEGYYEIWDDIIKNPVTTKAILIQYMLERHKDKQALKQITQNIKKAM